MKIEQIYTNCLAEAAYYIESGGEVAIIDPLRDITPYLERAESRGARIKFVFETHFHADFVSGHLDLADKTGATIIYGPTAQPNFDAYIAEDGEELKLGKVTIKVLHTPGHTLESSCFLLIDEQGEQQALFTGDTLFIGDVGRPDLAVKSDLSREDLAGLLFDSLRNKVMTLSDDITIYPGHGAGSACGKNMSKQTSDTLGRQRLFNYALVPKLSREDFIAQVTSGLAQPPQYFPKNASINKRGYQSMVEILQRGLAPLYPDQFAELNESKKTVILDTRPSTAYLKAHISGSLWIGIDDNFAPWVGALIEDLNSNILFIAEPGREEEVVTRLARVGYDHSLGYLEGGIEAWRKSGRALKSIESIGPHDFVGMFDTQLLHVLDVRKVTEFESQHIEGVENFPLDFIHQNLKALNPAFKYYVHCQGGYRSVIACSILSNNGFHVINIEGGINEIKKSCVRITQYKEPVSML